MISALKRSAAFSLFAVLAVMGIRPVFAQQYDYPTSVFVSYYSSAVCGGYYPSMQFGSELGQVSSANASVGPGVLFFTNPAYVSVVPNKTYSTKVTGSSIYNVTVIFPPIGGFTTYLNGKRATSLKINAGVTFTVRWEPNEDPVQSLRGARAGESSEIAPWKPFWYCSLGRGIGGTDAGVIGFRGSAFTPDLFTAAGLQYIEGEDRSVALTRNVNGVLTDISAAECYVEIDPLAPSSPKKGYEISIYAKSNLVSPYCKYTISTYPEGVDPAIAVAMQIDKDEDGSKFSTLLSKTAQGWSHAGWRTNRPGWDLENLNVSTISGNVLYVDYGEVNTSGGHYQVKKEYETISGRKELSREVRGPDEVSPIIEKYTYSNMGVGGGWSNAIKSRVYATGGWELNEYYNGANDPRDGMVKTIYRPWLSGPASPESATAQNSKVEQFNYVLNYDGSTTAVSEKVTSVNGVIAGKTTYSYTWNYIQMNGFWASETIKKEYSGATEYETTRILSYRPDVTDSFFREKPVSILSPSGKKVSYAYVRGAYTTESGFTASTDGLAVLSVALEGAAVAPAQGAIELSQWVEGALSIAIDKIFVEASKTQATFTVHDEMGRKVEAGKYIFTVTTGGALERHVIADVVFSYDNNNRLRQEVDMVRSVINQGEQGLYCSKYTWKSHLLSSKRAPDGGLEEYGYDLFLRRSTAKIHAESVDLAYPSTNHSYTYYPCGLLKSQEDVGLGKVEYDYDTAGRSIKSSRAAPGQSGSLEETVSYPSVGTSLSKDKLGKTRLVSTHLDGNSKLQTGSGCPDEYFSYSISSAGQMIRKKSDDQAGLIGWSETTFDWLGRVRLERTPQFGASATGAEVTCTTFAYDSRGLLVKRSVFDEGSSNRRLLADHIYVYNNRGECMSEGDDVDCSGALSPASGDSILEYTSFFHHDTEAYSGWVYIEDVEHYTVNGDASSLALKTSRHTRMTRFNNGTMSSGAIVVGDTVDVLADGSYRCEWKYVWPQFSKTRNDIVVSGAAKEAKSEAMYGYPSLSLSHGGIETQICYDEFGRTAKVVKKGGRDIADTSLEYEYFPNSRYIFKQLETGSAGGTLTTQFSYGWDSNTGLFTKHALLPEGGRVHESYNSDNLVCRRWGSGAEPSERQYDDHGKVLTLKRWQQSNNWDSEDWNSTAAVTAPFILTSWEYDSNTGLLTNKRFSDDSTNSWRYDGAGRVKLRTWARGIDTVYNYYDSSELLTGKLKSVSYSDGTGTIQYEYNRMGYMSAVTDSIGRRTLNHSAQGLLMTESLPTNTYQGAVLSYSYDWCGRRTGVLSSLANVGMGVTYDSITGQVSTFGVSVGTVNEDFSIRYSSGSDWVAEISNASYKQVRVPKNSSLLIGSISTEVSGVLVASATAQYDNGYNRISGQDVSIPRLTTLPEDSRTRKWREGFDLLGRITSSTKRDFSSLSFDKTEAFEYDDAGNRLAYTGVTRIPFSVDGLNQVSPVQGAAYSYDADGNLLNDGTWAYEYDAENRMVKASKSGLVVQFKYDYLGRRVMKWSSGSISDSTVYMWDGWRLVAEYSSLDLSLKRAFLYAPVSSDRRGVNGGVGHLVAVYDSASVKYALSDCYGNVVGYCDGSANVLSYNEFSPFGAILKSSASTIQLPIGFHSQYSDSETGLVYYGRRYYSPSLGRFIGRDPTGELGGDNLFAFAMNSPGNIWDRLGCGPEDDPNNFIDPVIVVVTPITSNGAICMDPFEVSETKIQSPTDKFGSEGSGVDNLEGGWAARAGSVDPTASRRRNAYNPIADRVISSFQPSLAPPSSLPLKEALKSSSGKLVIKGKRRLFESQAQADARYKSKVMAAIEQIKNGLRARAASNSPDAPAALKALFDLEKSLASDTININEVSGANAGGGSNPSRLGVVNWDSGLSYDKDGVHSESYVALAHELMHAINTAELDPSTISYMKNTTAGPMTSLWEVSAITFENLVRPVGEPSRFIHDSRKTW